MSQIVSPRNFPCDRVADQNSGQGSAMPGIRELATLTSKEQITLPKSATSPTREQLGDDQCTGPLSRMLALDIE